MKMRAIGMAISALILSIGIYLFPLGQDWVWFRLYSLVGEDPVKAWVALYVVSLGMIGIGVLILYGIYNKKIGITNIGGGIQWRRK